MKSVCSVLESISTGAQYVTPDSKIYCTYLSDSRPHDHDVCVCPVAAASNLLRSAQMYNIIRTAKSLFFFITLNLSSSQRKLLWLEILCSHFHWKVQPVNLEMLYYHHHRKCIMKKMSSISNNWLNPQPLRWWAWM